MRLPGRCRVVRKTHSNTQLPGLGVGVGPWSRLGLEFGVGVRGTAVAAILLALVGCSEPYRGEPAYSPFAASRPRPPVPEGPLDLEACLAVARANRRSLRIADRRVLIAKDRVSEGWATVLPKLQWDGRASWRNNDPGGVFGGGAVVSGERDVRLSRLTLLVPIYDFGASPTRLGILHGEVEIAGLDADRARQDLELAVRAAYFRVLEARKIQEVVDESIAVVERQLQIAKEFLSQGIVSRSDVLTAEVQLAERRQERILAQGNADLAVATLNRAMGIDVTRPTEVRDVLETGPWTGSFEAALRAAIDARPDLRALAKQVENQQDDYRATEATLAPRFYGFGQYEVTSDRYQMNKDWWSGGIGVQWSIFDGGQTFAQLRRKKKEIAEAIDLHDERIDDVVLEVKEAHVSLVGAAERIPVAKKAVEQGEENLRVVNDQYKQGILSSADVLREEDRLSRAKSSCYRSLYDYQEALARLIHAIGGAPPVK